MFWQSDDDRPDQTQQGLRHIRYVLNIIWAPELFWADTFGIVVGQH
jgi:hypothetical protein